MGGFNPYSIPPLLNLACFCALAAVAASRGVSSRLNLLFLAICGFGILLNADITFAFHTRSAQAALCVSRADHCLIVFCLPVYIQFFHTYLNIQDRRRLEISAWALSAVLAAMAPTPWFISAMQQTAFGYFAEAGPLYPLFGAAGLAVTVYVLAVLYRAAAFEPSPARKNRLRYLLVGFGVMGFLNGLNVLPIMGWRIYPPGNLSFVPLIVFAVGLFRYDLLDFGVLLEKGFVHAAISAVLTFGFAAVLVTADTAAGGPISAASVGVPILSFFAVAGFIGPVQARVRRAVDRRFFPKRYDFRRTMTEVSRSIVAVLEAGRIGRTVVGSLKAALQVEGCALFDRPTPGKPLRLVAALVPEDHPMADARADALAVLGRKGDAAGPLLRSRLEGADPAAENRQQRALDALGAEIALPLGFSDREPGLLLIGRKCSQRMFSAEDVDLLETLAGQTATALENARFCHELASMNRRLEQKVADRTRDLQSALAEKERTLDHLIRSESLACLGQLVAGVAHELNNPLASAKSLLQSIAEELAEDAAACDPDGERVDDLHFADRELGRAQKIVSSLLGLSRQSQTYTEKVDLNIVVKDALRVLYNRYKNLQIAIAEDLSPELPAVEGNFANLGQVVMNVVQNAVQAVADGCGKIRIKTRYIAESRQVLFECTDTGPGIDAAVRNDIFKPFFTTKPPGSGTGLGLYICHEIVRRHAGRIEFCPAPETGARFTVRLPACQDRKPPIDEGPDL